jgi:YggT family protein
VNVLIVIIGQAINLISMLVITQMVLGLLIGFNVVNTHNDFVAGVWRGLNALLDPLLRPVRKIMPDTGMIDFSPMVLIFALNALSMVLNSLAR